MGESYAVKKICCIAAMALAIFSMKISAYAGWLQEGGNWKYYDDNGNMLKNDFAPDGYYIDQSGNRVPFDNTENEDAKSAELSANFFFKYLETGDPSYLRGDEGIVPGVLTGRVNTLTGEQYLNHIDYQSCLNGYLFPTRHSGLTSMGFEPGKSYPVFEQQEANMKAKFDPRQSVDENYVPLYYNSSVSLRDNGSYTPYSGALAHGIPIYDVPNHATNTELYSESQIKIYHLMTQRDVYRFYKKYSNEAFAGTENMTQYELAEHLTDVVMNTLTYNYDIYNGSEL